MTSLITSPASSAPAVPARDTAEAGRIAATPERIHELAALLLQRVRTSIKNIGSINLQARLLAMNAQIEAARAGEAGRSFGVVGREMVALAGHTQEAAAMIEQQTENLVQELVAISRKLGTNVRGDRLGDLAHTNIDLIDRNLYERSCDCRWWATDAAVVSALEHPDSPTVAHASGRLGVILKAYTVYFDIVIANLSGEIIANGRPESYQSRGTRHADAGWFTSALQAASGDEFGFQGMHASPLAGGRRVLVYSCRVGRGSQADAEPIGVLGVVFNWDGLAQRIVDETPIEVDKRDRTQVCIADDEGRVLCSRGAAIAGREQLDLPNLPAIFAAKKASQVIDRGTQRLLVAHAQSPGFETYRTGWHSLIIQDLAGA